MKRYVAFSLFALLLAAPLLAQAPKGWMYRADRSTTPSDADAPGPIKFVAVGTGFRATNPQAAVFWHPSNTVSGNYSLKGTFTLVKPSDHTNYYGLVFGGSDLGGPAQSYIYFVIGQDGSWLIKRRNGDAVTEDVAPKTVSSVVKKPDANGTSTNALEVRVSGDKIEYLINGTSVHTTPKTGLTAKTDGIYGMRVNHRLEVSIDNFAVSKQ
jgi:hypothetical protein